MTTQSLALTFNGVTLSPISHKNQTWLTSVELAKALGYAESDSVTRIYNRNKDEFTENMTMLRDGQIDRLGESSGLQKEQRIFSLRGCHLVAMFSKTAVAKLFRVWVLDILDKETSKPLQYGLKDPINEPEPLKISYATKEQREPLVRAVRRLVSVASEKGKSISYENAHSIINLKMGVSSVEELTLEQIPQAMALVGDILERVVLEGEYIAKGEPEPQAKVEPEIPSEPFTNKEREQYNRITGFIRHRFWHDMAWASAIGYRIRKATNNPSPNHFRIADKPVMAKEFEYLFGVTGRAKHMMSDFEKDIIKRLVRGEENYESVFAEWDEKYKAFLNEIDQDVKFLLDTVDKNAVREFSA